MVRAFVGEARGWREYATLEHDICLGMRACVWMGFNRLEWGLEYYGCGLVRRLAYC